MGAVCGVTWQPSTQAASKRAKHAVLVYTNADVVFFNDLPMALHTVATNTAELAFFMVGARRDLSFQPTDSAVRHRSRCCVQCHVINPHCCVQRYVSNRRCCRVIAPVAV
jgi:hypothetical protein